MYPNGSHWASYGQYNVVPGALATSRSAAPNLDQASLTAAAGLSHNLPTHTSLPQRVLSSIPGMSLTRDLHSQLLGAMSPHMGTLGSQALHKAGLSLAQNTLAYESMAEQGGMPSVSSAGFSSSSSSDKALSMEAKDSSSGQTYTAVSQGQDLGQKAYVLYDYLPQLSSNTFTTFSPMDLAGAEALTTADSQRLTQPPPAHSSVSRHSAIQRNPYSTTDNILAETLAAAATGNKSVSASMPKVSQSQLGSMYSMLGAQQQQQNLVSGRTPAAHTPQPQVEAYDRASSVHNPYYGPPVTSYASTPPTTSLNLAAGQLEVGNVSYEAVSPAGALAEAQANDPAAFPSTVSLSDLNAIRAGCPDPRTTAGFKTGASSLSQGLSRSPSVSQAERSQSHQSHLLEQLSQARGLTKAQLVQMAAAGAGVRHQNSPLSGGESNPSQPPSLTLGSPQNMLPSSSAKQGVTPVQAVADSSTASKPKKPRKPRKPKNAPQSDAHTQQGQAMQTDFDGSMSPAFMSSSQQGYRGGSSYQSQQQQYQQQQDNQTSIQQQQQQQYLASSLGTGSLSSESNYQVLSSQVPAANNEQSSRSQQQQQSVDGGALISMPNARLSTPPSNKGSSSVSQAHAQAQGSYQSEQGLLSQGQQYDMQVYTSQPYMEQLVSGQSARLIPSNLYSESMHVAAGISVYPYTFQNSEGSTIDTAAFSSLLMDAESGRAVDQQQQQQQHQQQQQVDLKSPPSQAQLQVPPAAPQAPPSPPPKPSATCTNPLEEDDELCNFAQPPPELAEKERPVLQQVPALLAPKQDATSGQQQQQQGTNDQKLELKSPAASALNKTSAFQDTFLSFLMGQKQETLSSVTATVITDRPQLPKYIPEPRRPRPPPPPPSPPSARGTSVSTGVNSLAFSDDEDDGRVNMALKKAISTLDSDSNDSELLGEVQGKYCVQSTKDLTMKITLQNTLKKQNRPRGRPKVKGVGVPVGRSLGGDGGAKGSKTREPTPPPPRESIGRRAKDAAKEKCKKRKKYQDSDSSDFEESDVVKPVLHPGGSGSEYDSDKDPVWTPLEEQEAKRPGVFGLGFDVMSDPKAKKGKSKSKKSHKKQRYSEGMMADPTVVGEQPSVSSHSVEGGGTPHKAANPVNVGAGAGAGQSAHTVPVDNRATNVVENNFQVGQFVLEKKDVENYDSFPIWRVEQGRMLRKFEPCMHETRVCHKAVSTYSSFVPSMQASYLPIQVIVVSKVNTDLVEVMEHCRPTPPTDGSLETQYENDPMVEPFGIYLQTYLSQSLEPSFLAAIHSQRAEHLFYLEPMEEIDRKINTKLEEIDALVKWKPQFREAMRTKPQMREINRPNLKQSCQACEKSSPPTIKSVLFHGSGYDRFLLTDLPNSDNSSQEFHVGKFAAPYVTQYHSLQHFKKHLLQRCKAKVYMVRESQQNQKLIIESILDQCLQDRTWVLKIFQDFKRLLGEEK